MRLSLILILVLSGYADLLTVDVAAPEFKITGNELIVEGASHINEFGAPNLPSKTVNLALPPGAVVDNVDFAGSWVVLGEANIQPARPPLPLLNDRVATSIIKSSDNKRKLYYSTNQIFPKTYGQVICSGGIRKYNLTTVACYHFGYNPVTRKLYYAPEITVRITYHMPDQGSERARFWNNLINDITFDDYARGIIYNWQEAKGWYHTDHPSRANGYYIVIPQVLVNAVDTLVSYRQSQGYNVQIVTTEYINSNIPGNDLEQKIRNYLRQNMAEIEYALLVGFITDTPMRMTVPFNNDPDSPWNNPDISPIPADLYFAELTDHDTLSWNYDRDQYYGEVFNDSIQPIGDDRPDYHADIHLGRIPISNSTLIEDICKKMIAFDLNTDPTFKKAALLAGGIYYYANEDNTGRPRLDGANFMEELMNDGVINRPDAVYLYEKAGLSPCSYPATDSLCRTNQINYWQRKGVMYETHHGNYDRYARKIWAWDNGNGIPESNEIQWPNSLHMNDVGYLDNNYPATTFLRSCLCSKPEVYGLGPQLLHHGSSVVIGASRICWYTPADSSGIPYHWYDYLLRDTTASRGLVGDGYDMARNDLMDASGFWIIAYHYNLYGDPAIKQLGRQVSVEESQSRLKSPLLTVYPNPTSGKVKVNLQAEVKRKVELGIYDSSGRLVKRIYNGYIEGAKRITIKLPAGIYFLKLTEGQTTRFTKTVIVD